MDFLLSIPLRKKNVETSNVEIVVTIIIIINMITKQVLKFPLLVLRFILYLFHVNYCFGALSNIIIVLPRFIFTVLKCRVYV